MSDASQAFEKGSKYLELEFSEDHPPTYVLAGLIYVNWGRDSGNIIDPDDQGRQAEGLERLKSGNWGCTIEMDLFVPNNRRMIAYLFRHGYFRKDRARLSGE
jgi:hypothetical protein